MEQTERKQIIAQVYEALSEKGYRPVDQLIGYILSGDPSYITNHKNARWIIAQIDRHDLLKDILTNYFSVGA